MFRTTAIHVGIATISGWGKGKKHPGFLNVLKYRRELGLTPDELLTIKKKRTVYLITEEDRDTMFAILEDCERESEVSDLRQKLHLLTYSRNTQIREKSF